MSASRLSVLVPYLYFVLLGGYLADSRDYCESENFTPECPPNHVVYMTHAQYGRMTDGRCITSEHGNLNCMVDVRVLLERECSGKPTCDKAVASLVPERQQACPLDFRSYLSANYTCLPVLVPPVGTTCLSQTPIEPDLTRTTSGYLSSYVTGEQQFGGIDCPWRLRAAPGQRIRITLLDFVSPDPVTPHNNGRDVCKVLAILREPTGSVPNQQTICAGDDTPGAVYHSQQHTVDVRMVVNRERVRGDFLLKYEVIGCPDITPPLYSDVIAYHRKATVKCRTDDQQWTLQCVGTHWDGQLGNCTKEVVSQSSSDDFFSTLPYSFSVLVIVLIAVCIAVSVLVVGLICIHKRRLQQRAQYVHKVSTGGPPPVYDDNYHRQASIHSMSKHHPQPHPGHPQHPHPGQPMIPGYTGAQQHVPSRNDYRYTHDRHGGGNVAAGAAQQPRGQQMPPLPALPVDNGGHYNYGPNGRYIEHVYESPKFDNDDVEDVTLPRRGSSAQHAAGGNNGGSGPNAVNNNQNGANQGAQYFELDPELAPLQNAGGQGR